MMAASLARFRLVLGRSHSRAIASAALLLLLAACSAQDHLVGLAPRATIAVAFGAIAARNSATGIRVQVTYQLAAEGRAELGVPVLVPLAGTSSAVTLPLDLGECLSRGARSDACELYLVVSLMRDATVLDQQEVGPLVVAPGAVVRPTQPIALREVAALRITSPSGSTIALDERDTLAIAAGVFDASGAPLPARDIEWSSSAPVTIIIASNGTQTGRAIAVSPGAATLTATSGGREASVAVIVSLPPVTSVTLTTPSHLLVVGDTALASAAAYDKRAFPLVGRLATFSSSNPAVATVDTTGRVIAVGAGSTTVTATVGGVSGSVALTVSATVVSRIAVAVRPAAIEVGELVQALATVLDQRGRPISGRTVSWTSSRPAAATVDATTGMITGVAAGTTEILATSGQIVGSDSVTVIPAVATSIDISPSTLSIGVGTSTTLSATVRDRRGAPLPNEAVQWSSANTTIATVATSGPLTGAITGIAIGSVVVTASINGSPVAASLTVDVLQRASVVISSILIAGTSIPVPLNALAASVDVAIDYSAPGIVLPTRLELQLDGIATAAVVPNASNCPAQRCTLRVNTATYDTVTGVGTYPNATHGLAATLILADGSTTASPTTSVVFNNPSGIGVSVSSVNTNANFPNTAANPSTGALWRAGDVTLELREVRYGSSAPFASVSGTFLGHAFSGTFVNGVASIAFPQNPAAALSIDGYQTTAPDGDLPAISSVLRSDNSSAPTALSGTPTTIRVDNRAPAGGALVLNVPGSAANWIGGFYTFSTGLTLPTDAGVGLPSPLTPRYEVSGCGSVTWASFGGTGALVGECPTMLTNAAYQARAHVFDRLGNDGILVMPTAFGVDVTPPSATFTPYSYADRSIIDGASETTIPAFDLLQTDARSGVLETERSLARFSPATSICVIGAGTPGPHAVTNPSCIAQPGTADVSFPLDGSGYFTYVARTVDRAGNVSAALRRSVLVDSIAPHIGALTVPPAPVGGSLLTFSANISDDAEMQEASIWIAYDDLLNVLFSQPYLGFPAGARSVAFDDQLSVISTFTMPTGFIRHLEVTDYGSDSVRTGGLGTVAPTTIALRASDFSQAHADTIDFGAGSFSNVPGGTSWAAYNALNPGNRVVTFRAIGSLGAAPAGAKAQLIAPTGASSPFLRVDFFIHSFSSGMSGVTAECYVGSSATAVVADNGIVRTFTYVLPAGTSNRDCAKPGLLSAGVGSSLLVVGVSPTGDALASKPVGIVP
ncbi:MAG: Ig-like domain-containing protein [Gemmatimonadota bacterium]